MAKIRICDRCQKPLVVHDMRLQEHIDADYPGRDICLSCDEDIKIHEAIARGAAISGKSQKQVLQEWLALYGVETEPVNPT